MSVDVLPVSVSPVPGDVVLVSVSPVSVDVLPVSVSPVSVDVVLVSVDVLPVSVSPVPDDVVLVSVSPVSVVLVSGDVLVSVSVEDSDSLPDPPEEPVLSPLDGSPVDGSEAVVVLPSEVAPVLVESDPSSRRMS